MKIMFIFTKQSQSKTQKMKKSTLQTIAIIILCLILCTADNWF